MQVKWGPGALGDGSKQPVTQFDKQKGCFCRDCLRDTMTVPRGQLREGHLGLLGKGLKWLPKEGPCSQKEVWARGEGSLNDWWGRWLTVWWHF